jgi:hypothetical protein
VRSSQYLIVHLLLAILTKKQSGSDYLPTSVAGLCETFTLFSSVSLDLLSASIVVIFLLGDALLELFLGRQLLREQLFNQIHSESHGHAWYDGMDDSPTVFLYSDTNMHLLKTTG